VSKMINIGIVGYGNIGKAARKVIGKTPDMILRGIITRRPEQVKEEILGGPSEEKMALINLDRYVLDLNQKRKWNRLGVDVAILCGGSKEDTPVQGPELAARFNTVDSFDTHADIPGYFQRMDSVAKEAGNVSIVSAGWDPGIFSLERILGNAFLTGGESYTFWGEGVSQGHSDAARKVKGVVDARQYTIPIEEAIQRVRAGETPEFSKRQMHKRLVFIVAEEGADLERVKKEIVEMPKYYDEYDTEVIFISEEEMKRKHSAFPHGGFVLTSGLTGDGNKQILEYKCQLESNPEFTASVLVACARAAYRMNKEGQSGAFTILDFPLGYLSPHSGEILRSRFM